MSNVDENVPWRVKFMQVAIDLTRGERQDSYGSFYDNMDAAAGMLTAYLQAKYGGRTIGETDFTLTAQDVAFFLTLLKMARTFQNNAPHADNYVDGACYFAMAGEAAMEDYDGE